MINNARHKFKTNLLKASYSPDFEIAKTEWAKIDEERDLDECDSQLCICQRKVRNIIYMYNKTTNKSIFVGTKCYNKFELQSQTIKDEVYRNILLDAIKKGEYEVIDDIVIYSEYVMNRHIEYYRNIIDINKNKLSELLSIRKQLIAAVEVPYLHQELTRVETFIKSLYANEIKNEKSIKRLRFLRVVLKEETYLDNVLPFLSKRIDDIEKWISKKDICKTGETVSMVCENNLTADVKCEGKQIVDARRKDDKTEKMLIELGVPKETYDVVKHWHKCGMGNIIYRDFIRRINRLKHSKEHMNMIKKQLLMFYNIDSLGVKSLLNKIELCLKP